MSPPLSCAGCAPVALSGSLSRAALMPLGLDHSEHPESHRAYLSRDPENSATPWDEDRWGDSRQHEAKTHRVKRTADGAGHWARLGDLRSGARPHHQRPSTFVRESREYLVRGNQSSPSAGSRPSVSRAVRQTLHRASCRPGCVHQRREFVLRPVRGPDVPRLLNGFSVLRESKRVGGHWGRFVTVTSGHQTCPHTNRESASGIRSRNTLAFPHMRRAPAALTTRAPFTTLGTLSSCPAFLAPQTIPFYNHSLFLGPPGSALTGRDSHPLDDKQDFRRSAVSPLTSLAWSHRTILRFRARRAQL